MRSLECARGLRRRAQGDARRLRFTAYSVIRPILALLAGGVNSDYALGGEGGFADSAARLEPGGRSRLEVRVSDADPGRTLPCRLTIVDSRGELAPLVVDPVMRLAVRPGVVYTPNGAADIGLSSGDYTVYATRGFEYGMDRREVTLGAGQVSRIDLSIRREVRTLGLVAADTHVHTLTFSGHGDATIDERAVTLAGEGIELPVITDHDHFTDLAPAAERMGVRSEFTPVVGDEVTTNAVRPAAPRA